MVEPRRTGRRETVRAIRKSWVRSAALYVGMGLLLVVILVVAGGEIGRQIRALDSWIASLGPWGMLLFVGLFVLATSVFVPEGVLAVMAGTLFGMTLGLVVAVAGGLAAASVQYLLSRRVLRARIQRTVAARPYLAAVQSAVKRREMRLQVLLRLTPLNPATLNYLFGAAGLRFPGFLLASLAFLPHQVFEVYLGYAGRHVVGRAGPDAPVGYLSDVAVAVGLTLCLLALVLVALVARRAVAEAIAADEEA